MKKLLGVLLPVVVLSVGVLGAITLVKMRPAVKPASPEVVPPLVESAAVTAESVQLFVRAHGTVVPRTESRVVSEVAGRVRSVSPSWVDGGFFEAGDLLVALEQEVAEADVARRDWEAMNGEAPAPPLVVREPQVRQARAALDAARAMLEKARRDVERCRIVAPYPGRVRTRTADVGTYVQPGVELGRIYATDAAEVRLPVPDAELAFLDVPLAYRGEPMPENGAATTLPEVTLATRFAGREHTWTGYVVRTEGQLAPESRMVVLVCRVPDPYGRSEQTDRPPLAVGMFVEATIEGVTLDNAVALPRSALKSGGRVFVNDDGTLRVRAVDVLRTEAERVLLRGGVAPGERVILTPLETPVDGMRVEELE